MPLDLNLEVPDFLKGLLPKRDPFAVYHIKIPSLPAVVFEWHPLSKQVFFVRVGTKEGHPVADGINSKQEASLAVLYWARGYLEGVIDGAKAPSWVDPRYGAEGFSE